MVVGDGTSTIGGDVSFSLATCSLAAWLSRNPDCNGLDQIGSNGRSGLSGRAATFGWAAKARGAVALLRDASEGPIGTKNPQHAIAVPNTTTRQLAK